MEENETVDTALTTRDKVLMGLGFAGGVILTLAIHRKTKVSVKKVNEQLSEMFHLGLVQGTGDNVDKVLQFTKK